MKKLIIVLTLTLSIFALSNINGVYADNSLEPTWTLESGTDDIVHARATAITLGFTGIDIYINQAQYHTDFKSYNGVTYRPYIELQDIAGTWLWRGDLFEVFNETIENTSNFISVDIKHIETYLNKQRALDGTTATFDFDLVQKIAVVIPQTFRTDTAGLSSYSTYLSNLNGANNVDWTLFPEHRTDNYFVNNYDTGPYGAMELFKELPSRTVKRITLDFLPITYAQYPLSQLGEIVFYDNTDTELDTITFCEFYCTNFYDPNNLENKTVIDLDYTSLGFSQSDIDYYKIIIYTHVWPQEDYYTGAQYILSNLNQSMTIDLNDNFVKVEFYSQTLLLYEDITEFGVSLDYYYTPTPPTGFVFNRWYDFTNAVVTETTPMLESMAQGGVIKLYATFHADDRLDDPSIDDPVLDDTLIFEPILGAIGFDNYTGRLLMFLGIIFVLVILMIAFNLPIFVLFISILLLNILFNVFGYVPLWASVLIYTICAVGFASTLGGFNNE